MAILSNRNDYKFVNPVPNDIIIDGGILPARDAAQDGSWKILRGEDPAFILEATCRLDYSTNNFPRATIAVDWTPYVAQFKSNASPAYVLNEMDKHIRRDRLMQPFYTLRDLWQTGCCASGFMLSSEVRERTGNWGSSWNTSLPYVANVPLPDWNQGSPIVNYDVKWSGNTYLVADQLRELYSALKMMNHPTATGYGVTRVNGQAGTLPHSTRQSGPNGAELLQIYENGRNQPGYPYNWNDIIGFYSFNEVRRQGSGQYSAYASGGVGRLYVPSGMASEFAWTDRDQNRHTVSPDNVFVSTDVNKTQAILDFSIQWGRNSAWTRYAITPCPITAWVQSQPGDVGWFEISMTDIVAAAERVRQYFIAHPPPQTQGPEYKPYESLGQGQSWGVVINLQTINGIYTMDETDINQIQWNWTP